MVQLVKSPPANAGDTDSIPGLGRSLGGKQWQPTPVFLPGESHGLRSPAGYSPWDHKELDTTEQLSKCAQVHLLPLAQNVATTSRADHGDVSRGREADEEGQRPRSMMLEIKVQRR